MKSPKPQVVAALVPRGHGHQFVVYGDSCSGVPGALHERTFAAVNAVLGRLEPQPEFVIFTGDEIAGLTTDRAHLAAQWRHFLDVELKWPQVAGAPVYHVTGNHTAYDEMSEAVFRDVLAMPHNGPAEQDGLSYFIRRGDLLLVVVHTLWSGLGGEGHVETDWLEKVLREHADARHKLVAGHHPIFPVNGFAGPYQREVGPEHGPRFWDVLVRAGVRGYLCSHILAFDVQVHRGVLQITTAGAGTAHRMPEGIEYLHGMQMAVDDQGLRYQVLDTEGQVRERLSWPFQPAPQHWTKLTGGACAAPFQSAAGGGSAVVLRVEGSTAGGGAATAQTIFSTSRAEEGAISPLWVGLSGPTQRLTVILAPDARRSPHTWHGPAFDPAQSFAFELALHSAMGPGGILLRTAPNEPWTSLTGASPWGPERLAWPERWSVGHGQLGAHDRPFLGSDLSIELQVVERD